MLFDSLDHELYVAPSRYEGTLRLDNPVEVCLVPTAILAQYYGIHRFGIPVSQLENMPDFDTPPENDLAFAVWTGVSLFYVTKVGDPTHHSISVPVHTGEMEVIFIGSAGEIRQHGSTSVYDHGQGHFHGTQ